MKFTRPEIRSVAATAIVLLLLVGGGAFAYTTRASATNNHNTAPDPFNSNQTSTDSSSSSSKGHSETTTSSSHSETRTNENQQHELDFRLVPTVVQNAPQGYRLGHGEARIEINGTLLDVTVEVQSANPSTNYEIVLSLNGTDHDLGKFTTNAEGDGHLGAQLQLETGIYEIGVLLFDTSNFNTDTLVIKSDPLTLTEAISHMTTTTSSESETASETEHELKFRIVSAGPQTPGQGEANINLHGLVLDVHVEIEKGNASAKYNVVLSIDDSSSTIGTLTTNENGNGQLEVQFNVSKPGSYEIGIVLTLGGARALTGDPFSQRAALLESTETETKTKETQTSESSNKNEQGEHELKFRIMPATPDATGRGEANVAIHGTVLKVDVEIERANPSTQYNLVLSVNGTDHALGSLVTNEEGDGGIQAHFKLANTGTYEIGVTLLLGSTPALKSDPSTHTAILTQSTESETETEQAETHSVHTVTGDQDDEDQIKHAEDNKTIPAVVTVGASGVSALTLDPHFSVSVGKLENDGIAVSISAVNVTGPKVLLINLTGSSLANLSDKTLAVTFDGKQVVEASSISQVLSPSSTDPARFIILVTSSGVQLLVSIPHFSTHMIQVLPIALASPQSSLASNMALVVGSLIAIAAISAIAGVAYMKRKRV